MNNYKNNKLLISEVIISLLLVSVLFSFLFSYYLEVMPYTYGDTAFLIEVVDRLSRNLESTSYILSQSASVVALANSDLLSFCQKGLHAKTYTQVPYNWLTSLHAYLILYPISILAKYTGSLKSISFFNSIAFSLAPILSYFYMRLHNQKITISILATVLIMLHPAWLLSSSGQLYTERFYLPFSMILAFLTFNYLNNSKSSNKLIFFIFVTALLSGLISERSMAVTGIFLLSAAVIHNVSIKKQFIIASFGLLAIFSVFIYLHQFGGTPDNSRFFIQSYNIKSLIHNITVDGIGSYLFFNASIFLMIFILNIRFGFSILPILLLNCFVTVGGAEKNGWETHYHSHYYGFLVSTFIISITHYSNLLNNKINVKLILFLFILFISLGYKHYNYWSQTIYSKFNDVFVVRKNKSNFYGSKIILDTFLKNIPNKSSVTSTEWGLPILYMRGNEVNTFPMNIGVSDYLILQFLKERHSILASTRYTNDSKEADLCYTKIIDKDYSLIKQEGTWALFKKKN